MNNSYDVDLAVTVQVEAESYEEAIDIARSMLLDVPVVAYHVTKVWLNDD